MVTSFMQLEAPYIDVPRYINSMGYPIVTLVILQSLHIPLLTASTSNKERVRRSTNDTPGVHRTLNP